MINRLMLSVAAAALIAGTGFANAQGTGMSREAPSAGSAAQPSAPSSATPMNRNDASDAGAPAEKSAQSDEKMQPPGTKNQRAQDMKAGPNGEKSAQQTNESNMKGEKSKSMSSETNEKGAVGKDQKADSRSATDTKAGSTNTENRTTGNAATSANAAPPAEKRTQIASAIKQQKVEEVTNVNFNIAVGTAIPATVHFYPLPSQVVEIYPEWRGYDFILVRGQYIIIRPETHEIVYIIES
jgi:Protein of unknown function (DUF1236)